jgi:hypothetical protein
MNKTYDLPVYYPHMNEYSMLARLLDDSTIGIIIPLNCLSQVIEESNYNTFTVIVLNDNPEMVEIKVTLS